MRRRGRCRGAGGHEDDPVAGSQSVLPGCPEITSELLQDSAIQALARERMQTFHKLRDLRPGRLLRDDLDSGGPYKPGDEPVFDHSVDDDDCLRRHATTELAAAEWSGGVGSR